MDLDALSATLAAIADRVADVEERGRPAQYIPELASADPNRFGIAISVPGQGTVQAGDAEAVFSIQSVSKIFLLALALERLGAGLWQRVGRENSGSAFNSIVQLETERGIPRNPFINAGALVMADVLLAGRGVEETVGAILAFVRRAAGSDVPHVDPAVAASELATAARNRALANFMAAEGNLRHPVEDVLAVYVQACAISMDCATLARAGCSLLREGDMISAGRARRIIALMLTCGHYDASGEVAFRIGIPGKSGVGGGILSVVPGVAAIAAYSPGLDARGNPLLASHALEELSVATGWSVFAAR